MSALTDTFGITTPIVLAPMAGVAGGRLAHAVSSAGGLGMIGTSGSFSPDWIREQAAIAGEGATPLRGAHAERGTHSVAPQGTAFGIGLMAWVPQLPAQIEAILALGVEDRPALVSVSFGDVAGPIRTLREAGLAVACQVGNAADVAAATAAGADVIVARGGEGGGHGRNEMATGEILALALDETDAPVLAAGGIADAADVSRVMTAGAAGAWCGTAFLTCREGENTPEARAAIGRAQATRYSRVHDVAQDLAWPREFGGRAVTTPFLEQWADREDEMTDAARAEHAAGKERGDTDYTPLYAGVGVDRLSAPTDAASVVTALTPRG
ncbi:NAD(P)H-dependent flavin oxidoreductase [Janibacter cremeus]|uniref:Nitronate monooxygenase n=1 Tax=Janibacter cremeus TaxID=1285192 RepID=A0A852VPP5_9MICO|nr:nitronate monooxygenase [Janibacter cremeus]NYF98156.1 nitronate monooxygenase [Janibacter cremeus]